MKTKGKMSAARDGQEGERLKSASESEETSWGPWETRSSTSNLLWKTRLKEAFHITVEMNDKKLPNGPNQSVICY